MNWDAIGAVGEIIGAVGVIASLVFLALETRKNTAVQRASLSNDAMESVANLNDVFITDTHLRKLISKSLIPETPVEEITNDDWELVISFGRAWFMRMEGTYLLSKQGLIDPEVWETRLALAAGTLKIPIWAHYWKEDQKNNIYSPGFIAAINGAGDGRYRTPEKPN